LKLLTFPVSGPIGGGRWVLQTLLDEAERRYYDPAAIQQELADAERRYQAGEMNDEEFDELEEHLLRRLLEANEYQLRRARQDGE
jgi:hypothetical protein